MSKKEKGLGEIDALISIVGLSLLLSYLMISFLVLQYDMYFNKIMDNMGSRIKKKSELYTTYDINTNFAVVKNEVFGDGTREGELETVYKGFLSKKLRNEFKNLISIKRIVEVNDKYYFEDEASSISGTIQLHPNNFDLYALTLNYDTSTPAKIDLILKEYVPKKMRLIAIPRKDIF